MARDEQRIKRREKAACATFKEFLGSNPTARIETANIAGEERLLIFDPWSDPSVGLLLPPRYSGLAKVLNGLYLPPRYSALYHKAERQLEVIWTAYKLDPNAQEVIGREFSFTLDGETRNCGFRRSSDKLLVLAKHLAVRRISTTEFRNLRSYSAYASKTPQERDLGTFGNPVSFWIDNLDWDDDGVHTLLRHLNFYLLYYDRQSPVVVMHPRPPTLAINPRSRYFEGFDFPTTLSSPELDASLLVLWGASFGSVVSANFLNFYRIIEYVSYYFMHGEASRAIKTLIKQPHLLSDLDRAARDILLVVRQVKYQKEQDAVISLLKDVVKPSLVWAEIDQNRDFFTKPTVFEGDLTIDALITEKQGADTFGIAGVERMATSLTKIRNALAHGKDTNSHKTILPTSHNFDLLKPWLHLIEVAAGEVVLFDATH